MYFIDCSDYNDDYSDGYVDRNDRNLYFIK